MKRHIPILSFLIVAAALFVNACKSLSPSEVVEAAYTAANEGRYSDAEKYIFSESLNDIINTWGTLGRIDKWDKITRNGTIERVEIKKENILGEKALVDFILHFKDKDKKKDSEELIKEGRHWKLTSIEKYFSIFYKFD